MFVIKSVGFGPVTSVRVDTTDSEHGGEQSHSTMLLLVIYLLREPG